MKLSEIEKGFEQFYPKGEKCEFTTHAAAQICEVIMKPKWISVKDELPKKLGYYLVVVDEYVASSRHGVIEIQELYESVCDQKVIFKFQDYVTHWMPLPDEPISTTEA